jgi:hypothetical protein
VENLSRPHLVHHKTHTHQLMIELHPLVGEMQATNSPRQGTAVLAWRRYVCNAARVRLRAAAVSPYVLMSPKNNRRSLAIALIVEI